MHTRPNFHLLHLFFLCQSLAWSQVTAFDYIYQYPLPNGRTITRWWELHWLLNWGEGNMSYSYTFLYIKKSMLCRHYWFIIVTSHNIVQPLFRGFCIPPPLPFCVAYISYIVLKGKSVPCMCAAHQTQQQLSWLASAEQHLIFPSPTLESHQTWWLVFSLATNSRQ